MKIHLSNVAPIFIWFLSSLVIMQNLVGVQNQSYIFKLVAYSLFIVLNGGFFYLYLSQKQKKLQESEGKYRGFFYSNPTPLWIYDVNTLRFLDVNNAAIAHYGYSKSEFLSMDIMQIRPPEDHSRLRSTLQNLPENFCQSGHWKHLKKSGEIITVSISSHRIQFNGKDCEMVMALDVTSQLCYEESLKSMYIVEKTLKEELERNIILLNQSCQEKQRLADIIETVNNIIIITDLNGSITWVNQAFTKHSGYSYEEVAGKDTSFLHGPETDLSTQEDIMNSLKKGEVKSFEILNYTKDGKKYWTDLNISPVHNEHGELTHFISIQSNITDRKEREQQIKDQNAALRNIAWMNSHALRRPLASIISLAELGTQAETPEEIIECQKLIKVCSEELDESVKVMGKKINSAEIDI